MEKYLTISQAAREVGMTSETLRHYDRIGLVKPSRRDPDSGYRYYSRRDLVLLSTIRALRYMNLSLYDIREALTCDDLNKTVSFFAAAEISVEEQIEKLQEYKNKILAAKTHYQEKLHLQQLCEDARIIELPGRTILLSDNLKEPSLENLYNYLSNFYEQLDPYLRDSFAFEDIAGIYTQGEYSRLFAICIRCRNIPGLKMLPSGKYLCADCTETERTATTHRLMDKAEKFFGVNPGFSIQIIRLTGILQWDYQIQIPLF